MRSLFDTSVLVTAVVDQLANHEAAFDALRKHDGGEHWGCCSTHALAECYATLTALPLASRVLPEQARVLVEESIAGCLEVIELGWDDYRLVLDQVAQLGLASGAIYDALHADVHGRRRSTGYSPTTWWISSASSLRASG